MTELPEHRLKRLHMRSIRRGIKEMDLILTAFSLGQLATMDAQTLDHYEAFLDENDHDLYQWVSGQSSGPQEYANLIAMIKTELPGITGVSM